jgi:hypothetical protein
MAPDPAAKRVAARNTLNRSITAKSRAHLTASGIAGS